MLLSYSIISAFIIGFGYLAYIFTVAGERQHSFNRIFILTIYAVAVILPFIILSLIMRQGAPAGDGQIEIGALTGGIITTGQEGMQETDAAVSASGGYHGWFSANVLRVIYSVYLAGVVLAVIHTVAGWIWLLNTIRKGEKIECDGFTLVLTDDPSVSPFSWRNNVVMRRSDYDEAADMIMQHELAHLRLSHWADLLLAQCVICLQWFNPAAWALRDELKAVHEYQADEAVIASGADMKQYQLLLIKKAVGFRFQSLANSLNHSKLKKRVTMMYKKKTSSKRRLAAMLLVPALLAGCAVTAIPGVAGVIKSFALTSDAPAPEALEAPAAPDEEREIYMSVDKTAEFKGGLGALMSYLNDNIRYPEEAVKNDEQGNVIVRFVVEADGSIGEVKVAKGVTPLLDEEAIRIVKNMPKWTPAQNEGKDVASWFNLPIRFKLKTDNDNTTTGSK